MVKRMNIDPTPLMERLKIFSEFSPKELSLLSLVFQPMSYSKGELIFKEGEPGSFFLVLVSGKVGIYRHRGLSKPVRLNQAQEGGILGELSLIDNNPRNASAMVESEAVVLLSDRADFNRLYEAKSKFAYKLMDVILKDLSSRIRSAHKDLERMLGSQNSDIANLMKIAQSVQTTVTKVTDTQRLYKVDFK